MTNNYHALYIIIFSLLSNLALAGGVYETTLDNGLRLIVKEDHRAPIVVSQVWYRIGGSYEQEGKTGISHFLEHLMFKGTTKYPAGEFSKIMTINGASENAFTGRDFTAYFQTLEKSRLSLSFEMEADRMSNLVWDEENFAKEKQVVMEERRTRVEDNPISLMYEHFQATAFQTSPYQHPLIGWMNDIKNFTLADLQNWYQRWYAPNNAIVVVVGDVEPQAVVKLAQRYFGALKPRSITPPVDRVEIEQLGIKRITVKKTAKLPYLAMGYKVPALATLPEESRWQAYALEVLTSILDGGNSARFPKYLVRGEEVATTAGASYNMTSRLSDLLIFSGIPSQQHSIADLEAAIRAQIAALKTDLVEPAELQRVKNQLRAAKVYELDSQFYQGMQIGMLTTVGLEWQILDRYLDNIKAVTAEQIQTVARRYLIDDHLTIAVLEPLPFNGEL
jgi:zinc protease